jgi:hypothetical protein
MARNTSPTSNNWPTKSEILIGLQDTKTTFLFDLLVSMGHPGAAAGYVKAWKQYNRSDICQRAALTNAIYNASKAGDRDQVYFLDLYLRHVVGA